MDERLASRMQKGFSDGRPLVADGIADHSVDRSHRPPDCGKYGSKNGTDRGPDVCSHPVLSRLSEQQSGTGKQTDAPVAPFPPSRLAIAVVQDCECLHRHCSLAGVQPGGSRRAHLDVSHPDARNHNGGHGLPGGCSGFHLYRLAEPGLSVPVTLDDSAEFEGMDREMEWSHLRGDPVQQPPHGIEDPRQLRWGLCGIQGERAGSLGRRSPVIHPDVSLLPAVRLVAGQKNGGVMDER